MHSFCTWSIISFHRDRKSGGTSLNADCSPMKRDRSGDCYHSGQPVLTSHDAIADELHIYCTQYPSICECLNPRQRLAQYQSVDVL